MTVCWFDVKDRSTSLPQVRKEEVLHQRLFYLDEADLIHRVCAVPRRQVKDSLELKGQE